MFRRYAVEVLGRLTTYPGARGPALSRAAMRDATRYAGTRRGWRVTRAGGYPQDTRPGHGEYPRDSGPRDAARQDAPGAVTAVEHNGAGQHCGEEPLAQQAQQAQQAQRAQRGHEAQEADEDDGGGAGIRGMAEEAAKGGAAQGGAAQGGAAQGDGGDAEEDGSRVASGAGASGAGASGAVPGGAAASRGGAGEDPADAALLHPERPGASAAVEWSAIEVCAVAQAFAKAAAFLTKDRPSDASPGAVRTRSAEGRHRWLMTARITRVAERVLTHLAEVSSSRLRYLCPLLVSVTCAR